MTPDGTIMVDTRYGAATAAGASMALATQGFRHGPSAVLAQLAAGEDSRRTSTASGSQRVWSRRAPGLTWVNTAVLVGSAARRADAVDDRLYAVD